MGEVYRARDERLNRDVALKVLPASMAADEDRLRRFTLEAQSAGSLNHPNILTIYDAGTDVVPAIPGQAYPTGSGHAVPYLAAELLEGETLRDKLTAGAIPLSKAIAWARQAATGLAAAHAKGITHRDIKPENLFITTDGRLKILDFGLAKASAVSGPGAARDPGPAPGAAGGAGFSRPDTETTLGAALPTTSPAPLTDAGMVLGTAGYMPPEQVRAQPVDSRSDIFSLGVVLYEMLSGRRPFTGDSAVETMNAILTADPPELTPAASSDRAVPPAVAHVVAHCLEKNPEERFQSARDLAFALEALSSASTASGAAPAVDAPEAAPDRPRARWALLAVAALAGASAVALALGLGLAAGPPRADLSRYRFTAVATDQDVELAPAWSPDGRTIAYVRHVDGRPHIFLRDPGVDDPVQLTRGTEGAGSPFWFPDSSRLAFVVDGQLFSISRSGGERVPLTPSTDAITNIQAAAISPDGQTMALWASDAATGRSSLFLAPLPEGEPRRYDPAPFEQACCTGPNYLRFAPDGQSILLSHFGLYRGEGGPVVWRLPIPGGGGAAPRELFAGQRLTGVPEPSWLPDNRHVVVGYQVPGAAAKQLFLADVEADTLTPITTGLDGLSLPSVSPDGSRIAFVAGGPDHDLVEIPLDAADPIRPLLATSRNEYSASWSPGTDRYAYVTDRSGVEEVRVRGRAAGTDRRVVDAQAFGLALASGIMGGPVVSPDGTRVAYHVIGTGSTSSVWISPIGGGTPARLYEEPILQASPTWSPDGGRIAIWRLGRGLSVMEVGSREEPRVLADDPSTTPLPAWSPDGAWIAYEDDEGLHIVSPDGETRRRLAANADVGLAWSHDSRTIYTFDSAQRALLAIDVGAARATTVRTLGPDVTFSVPSNPSQRFSIAPDGRSLLATVARVRTDIWILEGFPQPRGLLGRLFDIWR